MKGHEAMAENESAADGTATDPDQGSGASKGRPGMGRKRRHSSKTRSRNSSSGLNSPGHHRRKDTPLAVVTGASSGLGAILSVQLAQRGYDLILVARNAAALNDTAARVREHGRQAQVLSLDLCREGDLRQLEGLLKREPVSVLVNNAGIGHSGQHVDLEPDQISTQIRLNAESVARLSQAGAHGFVRRGEGRILNLSSLAAFVPVPGFAVYAASKAFVKSFSLALSAELHGTGVQVTVACPGYTRTPFLKGAELSPFIDRVAMDPEPVCREILDRFFRGDTIVVTGLSNKLLAVLGKQLPQSLATWISAQVFRYQMKRE
jgi:short-subunit dehydrogenase